MKLIIDVPENIMDTIEDDQMISREQLAVLQKHILDGIPYNVCEEWKLLGNDNHINDSYGNCENYAPTVVSYEELEFLENLKGGCAGCRIITKLDQERRPKGEWIIDNEHTKNSLLWYKCNLCGVYHSPTNFCPNCGAKMKQG